MTTNGINNRAAVTIASTATGVPPHKITREDVKRYLGRVFPLADARLDAMMAVVDNSQVRQRYCIHPVDYIIEPRPLTQVNREYQEHAIRLGRHVVCEALTRAKMKPSDMDLFITVSCTGVMIPSIDAYLMNDLGFRSDARRLPITELGCAAGAAAFGRAWDFLQAYPEGTVMVLAVELPSSTFQRADISQANLISSILFGDGAAAAVLTGRETAGPRVLATSSHLFPNTLEAMGFDLQDTGFHIVLSKDVPQLIRDHIRQLLDDFLKQQGITQRDLKAFILHPGGQKLLLYMEEELGLRREDTQCSWDVLGEYGNLSSASVLFVLQEWLERRRMAAGEYGVMAAFGPGFSAEMLLLQWQ